MDVGLGLTSSPQCSPDLAEEPDAAAFLERARHQFPPDFVDGPDRSALVRYTWRWTETTADIERQSQVSQGRITGRAVASVPGRPMIEDQLSRILSDFDHRKA